MIVTNGYGSVPSQPALLTVLFAPVLSDPAIVPNNGFRMYLRGNRNYTYTLERSGDLSNWTSWGSVTYTNGPVPVVDSAGTNGPRRFYRVRRNP